MTDNTWGGRVEIDAEELMLTMDYLAWIGCGNLKGTTDAERLREVKDAAWAQYNRLRRACGEEFFTKLRKMFPVGWGAEMGLT